MHVSPNPFTVATDMEQSFFWEVAFLRMRRTSTLVGEFRPCGCWALWCSRKLHVVFDPLGLLVPVLAIDDGTEVVVSDVLAPWGLLATGEGEGGNGSDSSSNLSDVRPPIDVVDPVDPPWLVEDDPWIDILLPSSEEDRPVLPRGPHPSHRRGAAGDWLRINVLGGYLMYSERFALLDAHCTCHGKNCKTDRTLGVSAPVGRHMAWLTVGADPQLYPDQKSHLELKRDIGLEEYFAIWEDGRAMFMEGVDKAITAKIVKQETHRAGEGPGVEPRISR